MKLSGHQTLTYWLMFKKLGCLLLVFLSYLSTPFLSCHCVLNYTLQYSVVMEYNFSVFTDRSEIS